MKSAQREVDLESDFALVESILWEDCCGFWLLPEHLQRLRDSAAHFGFVWNEARILAQLDDVVKDLRCDSLVRVELRRDGTLNMRAKPASDDRRPVRAMPATRPIDTDNAFLYHDTTRREQDAGIYAAVTDGADETLLWNARGEVTGSYTSNLVVEIDGEYYTPPLSSGVLPDAYRTSLMQQGRLVERPIRLDELPACTKVYLINSSIGWREVVLG